MSKNQSNNYYTGLPALPPGITEDRMLAFKLPSRVENTLIYPNGSKYTLSSNVPSFGANKNIPATKTVIR